MKAIVEYDGIKFYYNIEMSLVEFDTSISGVTTDVEFFVFYSTFYSFIKYYRIRYFVLTKKNNDFELSSSFHNYRHNILTDDLLRLGIEKIFYLVSSEKKEKYRKELPAHVAVVESYEEIEALISEKRDN